MCHENFLAVVIHVRLRLRLFVVAPPHSDVRYAAACLSQHEWRVRRSSYRASSD